MRRVIVESPFHATDAATVALYRSYLGEVCRWGIVSQGVAPFASHGFYTRFLDDSVPLERSLGIQAGLAWGESRSETWVATDYGISPGMAQGLDAAPPGTPILEVVRNGRFFVLEPRAWAFGVLGPV